MTITLYIHLFRAFQLPEVLRLKVILLRQDIWLGTILVQVSISKWLGTNYILGDYENIKNPRQK